MNLPVGIILSFSIPDLEIAANMFKRNGFSREKEVLISVISLLIRSQKMYDYFLLTSLPLNYNLRPIHV